jgi:LigXa C-terminal domain like
LSQNQSNDFRIDREVQRTQSFTGIEGVHVQDQAITESMGEIVDHRLEHLGHSDMMVIRTRRRLIQAALDLRDHGTIPPGVDNPEVYLQAHSGDFPSRSRKGLSRGLSHATAGLGQSWRHRTSATRSREFGQRSGGCEIAIRQTTAMAEGSQVLLPLCRHTFSAY